MTIFIQAQKMKQLTMKVWIDDLFQSIYATIITNIQKPLPKGSGWILNSVIDHTISISKHNLLAGSSYIKLPKQLDQPRKGLITALQITAGQWSMTSKVIANN